VFGADTDVLQIRNPMNRLTGRLQDRDNNMFAPLLVILIASWSLFSGCANTKQAAHADSDSILQKPESDHEVHGEVGVMYGHSAR
jgi:hypothetical protein